jgi:alcohol dehydrogenase
MNIAVGPSPQNIAGSRIRIVFGPGTLAQLGILARAEGAHRVMLVTDAGIVAAGHADRAAVFLRAAGLVVGLFADVAENPTSRHVDAAVAAGRDHRANFLIGLGGGSAMDTARGANFVLSNGGHIEDYRGAGRASKPMLPSIAVPTTSGTGSEAQSFALISDPVTHEKMACGDPKAAACIAILDPDLTGTQPVRVAAAAGIDAIAHALETSAAKNRTDISRELSLEAWRLLSAAYLPSLRRPADVQVRADMLLGAHLAGAAIENSMLGAAHAAANPLTALFGIRHGVAVGLMLPHVVRFNTAAGANPYADLSADPEALARRIAALVAEAGLPHSLAEAGVGPDAVDRLAPLAAAQRTATFNPRTMSPADFLELYRAASV